MLWIATGAGLAPFASMLRAGARLVARFEARIEVIQRAIVRGQEAGCIRDDLPLELLWTMLGGLDDAIDGWFLDHPASLAADPALPDRTFAILRGLLEPPARGA